MTAPETRSPAFPWLGMLVLASLTFTAVTSEFLPTGLLPDIARSFSVSESRVGLLVTIFAGTVVASAAALTTVTRRFPRKSLIVVVLLVFVVGNGLAAIAANYETLVVARIIGGLAHGLFWSVVGAYSGHLVPKHQLSRAVAIVAGGATAAFVLGVPLGTLLGHAVGWRLAFATIGVVVLILTFVVIRVLPAVNHVEPLHTGEIALPMRKDKTMRSVLLLSFVILVLMIGQNTFYTYIAPYIIGVGGFAESDVGFLLFLYGGAGIIGLLIAGYVGSRYPRWGTVVITALVAVVILAIAVFGHLQPALVVLIVLWGVLMGAIPALVQTRMMHTASARIRDLASAFQTTAFNLGIGLGALLGGILLDRLGLTSLPWVEVWFLVGGFALMIVLDLVRSRRNSRPAR